MQINLEEIMLFFKVYNKTHDHLLRMMIILIHTHFHEFKINKRNLTRSNIVKLKYLIF